MSSTMDSSSPVIEIVDDVRKLTLSEKESQRESDNNNNINNNNNNCLILPIPEDKSEEESKFDPVKGPFSTKDLKCVRLKVCKHQKAYTNFLEEEIIACMRNTDLESAVANYFREQLLFKFEVANKLVDRTLKLMMMIEDLPKKFQPTEFSEPEWNHIYDDDFMFHTPGELLSWIFHFEIDYVPVNEIDNHICNMTMALASLGHYVKFKFPVSTFNLLQEHVLLTVFIPAQEKFSYQMVSCSFKEGQSKCERYLELIMKACGWVIENFERFVYDFLENSNKSDADEKLMGVSDSDGGDSNVAI